MTVLAGLGAADFVAVLVAAGFFTCAGFFTGAAAFFAGAALLAAAGLAAGLVGGAFSLPAAEVFFEGISKVTLKGNISHTLAGILTRPPIPLGRLRSPFSCPRLMALARLLLLAAELMSSLYLSARNLNRW